MSSLLLTVFVSASHLDDCLSESHYHVEHSTSRDVMRMVAFGSCVVYIMGNAFHTYRKIRYRGFVKRVGRTIRYRFLYCLIYFFRFTMFTTLILTTRPHRSGMLQVLSTQVSINIINFHGWG